MDPWEVLRKNSEQYSDAEFWDIIMQESYEPSGHSAADSSNPERADSGHSPSAPEADWAMIMDDDEELNEIRSLCQLHKDQSMFSMNIQQLLGLADPKFECTDSLFLDESRKNLDDIQNDLPPSENFSVDYFLNPVALLDTCRLF